MRIKVSAFILLLFLLMLFVSASAKDSDYEDTNEPFKVHGRLRVYNGNPLFRIWIIGTNRILGIRGGDPPPAMMPPKLESLMTLDTTVYADFYVTPLSKYKRGVMQIVRIDAVENLVIYRQGKFIEKKKKLQP